MLALLSSPIRRFLLITLAVPVVAFILTKLGLFLQKRNGGQPTRVSRAFLSSSAFLRRRVSKNPDQAPDAAQLSRG